VSFSLAKLAAANGVLQTHWGPPVLFAALCTVALGVAMLSLGPRLAVTVLSLGAVAAGAVMMMQAIAAADAMAGLYHPGLGLFVTLLTGILLVPIGFASLAVGLILRSRRAVAIRGGEPPA
jgi:hypothetical protein